MTDYKHLALELVDNYLPADDLLVACLRYMSMQDVKDMLEANEYLQYLEEDYPWLKEVA